MKKLIFKIFRSIAIGILRKMTDEEKNDIVRHINERINIPVFNEKQEKEIFTKIFNLLFDEITISLIDELDKKK